MDNRNFERLRNLTERLGGVVYYDVVSDRYTVSFYIQKLLVNISVSSFMLFTENFETVFDYIAKSKDAYLESLGILGMFVAVLADENNTRWR